MKEMKAGSSTHLQLQLWNMRSYSTWLASVRIQVAPGDDEDDGIYLSVCLLQQFTDCEILRIR